ncbi:LADA_0C02212g1_1 [Lachancea dasiensis]|uniref:LADA_0C02212g1_1 n=1 Tax=Lachancea dasiensis TaxID=1072105 RepID=A0A1G4IY14_9SACH|nr:LADA_0C02212g1_1 [Lachancea dasiensis]
MQYVGRAIGTVSKTWSSINPATLSGAIDVVVVEHPDGRLACSPFHVRFGKFQILKPSQKKVLVSVNGQPTNIPMKLGDSGEAYFVFETEADRGTIPDELISSPVASATSSPSASPNDVQTNATDLEEPDFLDIGKPAHMGQHVPPSTPPPRRPSIFEERARKLNERLHQKQIPSKFDNNGDLLLDIEGYKPSKDKVHDTDAMLKQLLRDELGTQFDISSLVKEDRNGNMRIINPGDDSHFQSPPGSPQALVSYEPDIASPCLSESSTQTDITTTTDFTPMASANINSAATAKNFIKTIRLTSEQLHCLDLRYGENELSFSVDNSRAIITAKLFLWRWDVPLVISDIDGTITKSDALGHVFTMIGRDWTHLGVAELFTEIKKNGYNVVYLTARSAGQADSTRSYLNSIVQDGCKLPRGPVILSPDRTMAALRREVILKKPEVFKIACLNDLRKLYYGDCEINRADDEERRDDCPTPFVAGFGNRITDALAYRTVGIPSSRIFTINPDGEVHMELLELAGYRSSYIHINELVDHFFPPVGINYPNGGDDHKSLSPAPGSPVGAAMDERSFHRPNTVQFTDVNFWREPVLNVEDLSDLDTVASDEDVNLKQKATFGDFGFNAVGSKGTSHDINSAKPNTTSTSKSQPSSSKDVGRQIYLELGSPLASPRLSHMDDTRSLDRHFQALNISTLSKPSTQVSALSVLHDGRSADDAPESKVTSTLTPSGQMETTDDEFDEDEFEDDDDEGDDEEEDEDEEDDDYQQFDLDEPGDSGGGGEITKNQDESNYKSNGEEGAEDYNFGGGSKALKFSNESGKIVEKGVDDFLNPTLAHEQNSTPT